MEGPFPAPQRMQPLAPAPPSWEQCPPPTKSSKRVSLSTQGGVSPRIGSCSAAERHDDGAKSSAAGDSPSHEAQPSRTLSGRRAAPCACVAPRGVRPEAIPEALMHDEHLQDIESYYCTRGPDVNAVFFERAFLEDLAEREVAYRLRHSIDKVASRFVRLRIEGLRESLAQLTALVTEAAVEAATKNQLCDTARHRAPADGRGAALGLNALRPYDSIRAELLPSTYTPSRASAQPPNGAGNAVVVRSLCWDRAQRALRGVDLTMPLTTYVLSMRTDTRGMMNRGLPVRVELSEEEALAWVHTPASAASSSSSPLLDALTGVSWTERQLALRVVQGLSLTVYHQRRCIADGFLFHYATEQMLCFLQHVEARHRRQHREGMQSGGLAGRGQAGQSKTASPLGDRHIAQATGHGHHGAATANTRVVHIDEDVVAALIALVEAVEAACHYCAASLSRLVQAGGVVALMNVVYCPYAPRDLRASILDTISVLLQEVAPFRRMVVSAPPPSATHMTPVPEANGVGSPGAGGGPAAIEHDEALRVMLHGALHGYSEAPGARAAGVGGDAFMANLRKPISTGPPPYGLDRASASKFDSAVREWLSQHGLSHVVSGVLGLRDVSEAAQSEPADPAERTRLQRVTQRREKRIQDLLLVIDGRRAELD